MLTVAAELAAASDGSAVRATLGTTVELSAPTADERSAILSRDEDHTGPVVIGFGRDLADFPNGSAGPPEFDWQSTPDGTAVAAIVLISPGAAALRAQLTLKTIPDDLEAGFYNPRDIQGTTEWVSVSELASTVSPIDGGYLYWSPTVIGDHIGIELRSPSSSWHNAGVTVTKISHLERHINERQSLSLKSCAQTDAVCRNDRISDTTRNSVANYLYTTPSGSTGQCTGTLLNDQDLATQIPYFLTADHCISSDADLASMEFYWFHGTPVCGDGSTSNTFQQGRGATRLAREGWYVCTSDDPNCPGSDMMLLRLNQKPPYGVGLAGWTTKPVVLGDDVVALHHPSGAIKKILIGTIVPHNFPGSSTTHALIRASEGKATPGSSGAGIWRRENSIDYLVGTLSGSTDSTCPPQEKVSFGRFSRFHARIADWVGVESVSEESYVGGHAGFLLRKPLGVVVTTLSDGDSIDLNAIGDGPFNIQADFSLAMDPASATVELMGPLTVSRTSNDAPHRLIAPGSGIGLEAGDYTLAATAYDGSDGTGDILETQSIAFSVIGNTNDDRSVGSLWLADASDGTVFGEITDSGTVTVNRDVDASLELRAATAGSGHVGSVAYQLSGPRTETGVANGRPFSWPVSLPPGTYSVTATPYSSEDGEGVVGTALIRSAFTVTYSPTLVPVRRFVLTDASDGSELMDLVSGTVVDLDLTTARSFNIQAVLADSVEAERVEIDLTGPLVASLTSSSAPHTLHGVSGGGPLVAGDYTISATPYAADWTGDALPTRIVSFKVIGGAEETNIAATRLTLIDDSSGEELATLSDGTVIQVPNPSGTQLAIRADTGGATVGSVEFELAGPTQATHTANAMPFTWRGTLSPGTYTITATPYPEASLTGEVGEALRVENIEIEYAYARALRAVTMVDAGASVETDIATLSDGASVDLAATSKRMKLRFDLESDRAGSLRVELTGPVSGEFLHDGDDSFWLLGETAPGAAAGRALPNGNYTLVLTLYEGSGGTGFSRTITLRFTVTGSYNQADSPISGFTIVDAEGSAPDPDVADIVEGARIDLSGSSARSITLRANSTSDPRRLAGVNLELTGPVSVSKRENGSDPYSIYGEAGPGDYVGALLPDGDYTITATPYSAESAFDPVSHDGVVRLVGGDSPADGRVEVKQNGAWSTVCDSGWDLNDADVVCAQLGLGEALGALGGAFYGRGSGPIALGNVQCTGNETELLACPYDESTGCGHGRDAGAVCTGTPLTLLTHRFSVVNSTPANPVLSFTAIRAEKAPTELGSVVDGGTLDLSATGLVPLTFRADVPAETEGVGSIRVTLTGAATATRMDNAPDYTLHPFDARSGRYRNGVSLANGEYTIEATAFSESNGAGTSFGTTSVTFTVVGSEDLPATVTGFGVVHPSSPGIVRKVITDGTSLDLDALVRWAPRIDIRPVFNAGDKTPGSVQLELRGATTASRLVDQPPFFLFGNDSDGNFGGRLATGVHTLTAIPYSEAGGQGLVGRLTAVQFTVATRPLSWDEFALGQPVQGSFYPSGLYSDGATTWVSDLNSGTIFAYRSWEPVRVPSRDIVSGAHQAGGLWSDGATLLVADYERGRLVAHRLADGVRQSSLDIQLDNANGAPSGVWSDGNELLVADYEARMVFGYSRAGARRSDLDIDVSADVNRPWGVWSNGRTVWVADWLGGGVRAFSRKDGRPQPSADINTSAASNPNPMGLHADGNRLWTTDSTHHTVHAYYLPLPSEATEVEDAWTTTMTIGDNEGRGFSTLPNPDVGSLQDVTFEHAGAKRQIQVVAVTSDRAMFRTRNGGDTFDRLVLEWGGVVLPLDDAVREASSTFTWNQAWLTANAPSLNATNFETTLPIGGLETVCLRIGSAVCHVPPTFVDGVSALREVLENAPVGASVGAAVQATGISGTVSNYSIAGQHASEFVIDTSTGQLTTATALDHEMNATRSLTVSAVDVNGGATSIPLTVSVTDVDEPPDTPSAPIVSGVSNSTLSVSWSAPKNAGRPVIDDYDVRYSTDGSAFFDWTHDGTETTTTIDSLLSDTAYQVQVLAKNADGASGWSASGAGRTHANEATTLTASFEDIPAAHDGQSEFTLTLKFNARVSTLVRTLHHERLSLTNGTVTGMRGIDPTSDGAKEFVLRIRPTGNDAVTVTLVADGTACDAGGVCTADGVQLTETASTTVPGPAEGDIRLVDGGTPNEGRLEIHHVGTWGTVCDDRFTLEDATVVCRQLGLTGGRADRRAAFGAGTGTIWVDDIQCNGDESRLTDCPSPLRGVHNCDHAEDVGVSCESTSAISRVSGSVSGLSLTLRFDQALDPSSVPSTSDFVVVVHRTEGAMTIPVETIEVVDDQVVLTLSRQVETVEKVSASYLPAPMHPLQDTSFNSVPAFLHHSIRHSPDQPTSGTEEQTPNASPFRRVTSLNGNYTSNGKIEVLDLSSRDLVDISSLVGRSDVEILDLGGNRISDLWSLVTMSSLEVLDLRDNSVDDISALSNLSGLRVLDLSGNAITDVSPLANLTALRRLNLSDNTVTDLQPLSELHNLQVLLLDSNQISDLMPLWSIPQLVHLGLRNNYVSDAAPLREARSLQRLGLAGNLLRDVSVLDDLSDLVWLQLSENPIADYSPLRRLSNLHWLWLDAKKPIFEVTSIGTVDQEWRSLVDTLERKTTNSLVPARAKDIGYDRR